MRLAYRVIVAKPEGKRPFERSGHKTENNIENNLGKIILRYKSEGPGIDSLCRRGFFPWHLTVPCALGSTQPLKMSTRLILGVKAAGA
jgi:hypothetical protein